MERTPYRSNWPGPSWESGADGELHVIPPPALPAPPPPRQTGARTRWAVWWLAGVVGFLLAALFVATHAIVPAALSFSAALLCATVANILVATTRRQDEAPGHTRDVAGPPADQALTPHAYQQRDLVAPWRHYALHSTSLSRRSRTTVPP